MLPKNSGGSSKFPGGHKVIHRTAQTAFVRVVTLRRTDFDLGHIKSGSHANKESRIFSQEKVKPKTF